MIVTTHRIIYCTRDIGYEIPLHYVRKLDKGGGMIHSNRVEVILDDQKLNSTVPQYIIEYTQKVLKKSDPIRYQRAHPYNEYYIKRFPHKESRDKCYDMI